MENSSFEHLLLIQRTANLGKRIVSVHAHESNCADHEH